MALMKLRSTSDAASVDDDEAEAVTFPALRFWAFRRSAKAAASAALAAQSRVIRRIMVALYAPYVSQGLGADETVVAFSTVVGPGVTILRLGVGYALLGRLAPDLIANREELEAAREASQEA